MKRFTLFLLVCSISVVSCVVPPSVERIPFPQEEYDALPTEGTGIVRGQAFLKTRGGDVKTAAGESVRLNPVTSYSQQWFDISYSGSGRMAPSDPRNDNYIITTIADGDGRFVFKNVPPGEYFLGAFISWYAGGYRNEGGYVATKISVSDGDDIDVIVTR